MPDTAVAPRGGSGIGQLLRDPDHYEEINVIGNGEWGAGGEGGEGGGGEGVGGDADRQGGVCEVSTRRHPDMSPYQLPESQLHRIRQIA